MPTVKPTCLQCGKSLRPVTVKETETKKSVFRTCQNHDNIYGRTCGKRHIVDVVINRQGNPVFFTRPMLIEEE